MGMIRDSFIIFKNWTDAIEALPEEYQLETYKALVKYGTTGEIPSDLSPIANAMLISFSVGMESTIAKYNASVNNGKLGGRPKKTETQENPEKPNETQENQSEPTQNLNVNVNDNVNVSVNDNVNVNQELVYKNKKNIFEDYENAGACVRVPVRTEEERHPYLHYYREFFEWCFHDKFKQAGYEVIDTIIEAREQARSEQGLKFNQRFYNFNLFVEKIAKIDCDKFRSIITQIVYNENIEHRAV